MGDRRRYARVACVAGLLGLALLAPRPVGAHSQTLPVAAPSSLVVHPFFILPRATSNASPTLLGLSVESFIRSERVTTACSGCRRTRFVGAYTAHRFKLRSVPPLRMGAATRVLVGVVATGETGRWIEFGFRHHHYVGLGHGCMSSSVKTLTSAEALQPRESIPSASCGPRSPPGTEYVYWTGTDHQIYENQYPSGTPTGWDSFAIGSGNQVLSPPAVVIRNGGERDVFWEGFDRHLHWMSFTDQWNDETTLPAGTVRSGPAAVVDAKGNAHIFWKGTTGFLYEMSDLGSIPQVTPLNSGPVGSAPAIVARPDGTLDLFWWGTDKLLWEMPQAGDGASARCIAGANALGSPPAAALDTHQIEDVFWRGTDSQLWELTRPNDPRSTSIPQGLPGRLGSAPAVVVHPNNVQDIFWRGTGGGLWEMVWPASNPWLTAHPIRTDVKVASSPAAVLSAPNQPPAGQVTSAAQGWRPGDRRATISASCPT